MKDKDETELGNLPDERLRDEFAAEEIQRLKDISENAKEVAATLRAAESEKEEAKSREDWDALAKAVSEIRTEGYDTAVSAMLHMLNLCEKILTANPLRVLVKGVLVNDYWDVPGIAHGIASDLEDSKELSLPDMQYFVEFTADDKLSISSLGKSIRRKDGQALTPAQEQILQEGMKKFVGVWLNSNGYELKGGSHDEFVSKADKTPLTKAEFEKLRDNPARGLDDFLTQAYGLQFRQAPGL